MRCTGSALHLRGTCVALHLRCASAALVRYCKHLLGTCYALALYCKALALLALHLLYTAREALALHLRGIARNRCCTCDHQRCACAPPALHLRCACAALHLCSIVSPCEAFALHLRGTRANSAAPALYLRCEALVSTCKALALHARRQSARRSWNCGWMTRAIANTKRGVKKPTSNIMPIKASREYQLRADNMPQCTWTCSDGEGHFDRDRDSAAARGHKSQ